MPLRLLFITTLTVACPVAATPIPEDAKAPALYFPTTVGARWVYERAGGASETVVVAEVKTAGREQVVSRGGADGTTTLYAKVVVSSAGLRQEQDVFTGRPGTVWLLKTPFLPGDSWRNTEQAGDGKRTVYGPERVDVPAGKYMAAKVVFERAGGGQLTSWYAPGVGEVKRVERLADGTETVTRSLKSFTPVKK
jgi:hypothetical protein